MPLSAPALARNCSVPRAVTWSGVIKPVANGGTSKQRLGTSKDVF